MSVFSIPVTISIDEEKMANDIRENVEAQVDNKVTEHIESIICAKTWGSRVDRKDLSPLRDMITDIIEKLLKEHEQYIIESAISTLSTKLVRKKITQNMLEKELIEKIK